MAIQDMIDAAPPGGTVSVAPGTYSELLVINKPLTLEGPLPSTGVAIVDSTGMAANATLQILSSQVTVRFMTFQNGPARGILVGHPSFPDLEDVLIENCTIRGHDLSGIINLNHSAMDAVNNLIENNGIISSFERAGIYLREHGKVNIKGNTIRNNNGESVYAQGGSDGLMIEDNFIENEASGGILLNKDQRNVTITGNTIKNCGTGADTLQAGIVIVQSMAEEITDNVIINCNYRGIMWGWVPSTGPAPDKILISSNRISDNALDGIYLYSQGAGGFTPPDPFPLKPQISGNKINNNGNAGVFVSNVFESAFPGNADPLLDCNDIQENVWGAFNQTANIIDAKNNWWGDSSGPHHPVENPNGAGNPVSDNINFIPWRTEPCPEPPGPQPSITGIDCIETNKVVHTCRDSRVERVVIDISDLAEGEIRNAECLDVERVVDPRYPLFVRRLTDAVLVSFYLQYRLRFQDDAGWKDLMGEPVLCQYVFAAPSTVRNSKLGVKAEICFESLKCIIQDKHQVACFINIIALLYFISPVRLLIPVYRFCPCNTCLIPPCQL